MRSAALLLGATLLVGLTPLQRATGARGEGADGVFNERRSAHFVLYQDVAIDRYSGPTGSRQFERDVLDVLEEAHDSVAELLGVRPVRLVEVVVYDENVFDAQFGELFGFSAAGFYHGQIRIRGAARLSEALLRTLRHEYVHAALDGAGSGPALPAWLNEGLAEWFEAAAAGKRLLDRGELTLLSDAHRRGALPSLEALSGPSFSRLPPEQASLAYLKSYALIEHLARLHGEALLRRFIVHVIRTGNVERALQQTYRRTAGEIERDLHGEL